MNTFDFYKELYFKELEKRTEINNSLSVPIGIISALIAAVFYFITSFDNTCSILLSGIFWIIICFTIGLLGTSIYHLIKSYSNLHKGYAYSYLADANDLEKYRKDLQLYYEKIGSIDKSEIDFEIFLISEFVTYTDENQKNNKTKNYHRYNCEKYLIIALIPLVLSIIPYSINYGIKNEGAKNVTINHNTSSNKSNTNKK